MEKPARRSAAVNARSKHIRGAGAVLALACGLLAAAAPAGAADSLDARYFHRNWRRSDGLPGNSVYAIAQTPDGYLWAGTESGLARFDGQHFTSFRERVARAFRSRLVAALAVARDGTLWIGTERGLLRLQEGKVVADGAPGSLGAEAAVTALAGDAGGDLWIGTRSGLLRRSAQSGEVTRVGMAFTRITQLQAGGPGEVWIGSEARGPWRFRAGSLERVGADPRLWLESVTALLRGEDGSVTVFTPAATTRFKGGDVIEVAPGVPPAANNVAAAAAGGAGAMWLATTDHGLVHFAGGESWLASGGGPLAGSVVFQILVAQDRSVWFGAAGDGLHQLVEKSCVTYNRGDGLATDPTVSVLVERGGTVWIGTLDGVTRAVRDRGSGWSAAHAMGSELRGMAVYALLRDSHGTLWAGTSRGLARRRGERWAFLPPWGVSATLAVSALYEDDAGNVWVGTAGGLGRLVAAATRVEAVPALAGQEVTGLAEDGDGALWIGTRGAGLLRLQAGKLTTLRSADKLPIITSIRRGQAGDMWVGTFGDGLLHFHEGRWFSLREANGLADDTVRQLQEDPQGDLWMCTGAGISRLHRGNIDELEAGLPSALRPLAYGPEEGVADGVCYGFAQPGAALSADGHLWFATSRGLVEVRPERLSRQANGRAPRLDSVTVDGRELAAGSSPLTVSGSTRRIDFRFSVPVFVGRSRIALRYRLVGFDPGWLLAGRERLVRYTSLESGNYRFEVAMRDQQGRWSVPTVLARIEVEPQFYQHPGFAALVALALLGAAVGGHRLAARRLLRRSAALELMVGQRTEQLQVANLQLQAIATSDALTGLANRRLLQETMEKELRRAARGRRELSLVLIDVDYFKRYNDSLGHVAGDECLRRVAMALGTGGARPGDLVARYGGEEFAVLLPETAARAAFTLAENLRQTVEKLALPHPDSLAGGSVTISAGVVSLVPDAACEPADLITAADEALYRAKQQGRNRVLEFDTAVARLLPAAA